MSRRTRRWARGLELGVAAGLAITAASNQSSGAVPLRVVCIGDSITYRNHPAWEYPTYVREALGPDDEVSNCGHNGALLTEQPARATDYYLATQEYQNCKQALGAADVVTIMLGTNDSGYWPSAESTFEAQYLKLASELKQQNADVKIVAATSPAAVANWNNLIQGVVIRDQIAPRVRSLASAQHFALADVQAATAGWMTSADLTSYDMTKFADAGVHPNEAGARIIAQVFVAAIEQATAEPDPIPSGGAAGAATAGDGAGSAGAAGAAGSAGSLGNGAGAAQGGNAAAGAGGAGAGNAGTLLAGAAGMAATTAPSGFESSSVAPEDGCACRVASRRSVGLVELLAALVGWVWRRRRSSRLR